jgi:uncharacterized membrane protein YphA (DoxX/SURF4 family)
VRILAVGRQDGFFEVHAENSMVDGGWPVHLTSAAMALALVARGPGRLSLDAWWPGARQARRGLRRGW